MAVSAAPSAALQPAVIAEIDGCISVTYKVIPIQNYSYTSSFWNCSNICKSSWHGTVQIQGGMALRCNKGHQFFPLLEPAVLPKGCCPMENCNHLSVLTRPWMYRPNPSNAEAQEGSLKQRTELLHKFSSLMESERGNTAFKGFVRHNAFLLHIPSHWEELQSQDKTHLCHSAVKFFDARDDLCPNTIHIYVCSAKML